MSDFDKAWFGLGEDFDPRVFTFTTVWTGFEQVSTIGCGVCVSDVVQWTGVSEGDSIALDKFDKACRDHWMEKHGE